MQSRHENGAPQQRLLVVAMLWLAAGVMAFVATRPGAADGGLPQMLRPGFIPSAVQPMLGPFLTLAITVALLLMCMWALKCSRDGAFVVCAGWMLVAGIREFGNRSDLAAWLGPYLPDFMSQFWVLNHMEAYLSRGTFDANELVAVTLGTGLAYMVALNTIPHGAG
ncbi:MAG TPA: hypothetical protein VG225_12015 [Terracidiphilus sp.]|jgi:hypothetical protein|nr:hypothetical protein [Terracidiphilus sp.]